MCIENAFTFVCDFKVTSQCSGDLWKSYGRKKYWGIYDKRFCASASHFLKIRVNTIYDMIYVC